VTIESNGVRQLGEQAGDGCESRHLDVRNGNAAAEAGRTQALALQKRIEDVVLSQPGDLLGLLRQQLQSLLFVLRGEIGHDAILREEICKVHAHFVHLFVSPWRAL